MRTNEDNAPSASTNIFPKKHIDGDIPINVANRMKVCRESKDIVEYFTLRTPDGGSFAVHLCVLCVTCKNLENFTFEQKPNPQKCELIIKVDNVSAEGLKRIIDFLYTGEIEVNSIDETKQSYDMANFLGIESIKEFCTNILCETINKQNYLNLWRLAIKNGTNKLHVKCIEFVMKNLKDISKTQLFSSLKYDEIEQLLNHERYCCSEEDVYMAIEKWITDDMENRENYLEKLFEKIKFELIGVQFCTNNIIQNKTFSHNKYFLTKVVDICTDKIKTLKSRYPKTISASNILTIIDDEIYKYDNCIRNFSPLITSLQKKRHGFASTICNRCYLFVCGGEESFNEIKTCEYYSFNEKKWVGLPDMRIPSSGHCAINLHNTIYVFGGLLRNQIEKFDLGTESWLPINIKVEQPFNECSGCILDNCIYSYSYGTQLLQCYDPRKNDLQKIQLNAIKKEGQKQYNIIGYEHCICLFGNENFYVYDVRNRRWSKECCFYQRPFLSAPSACVFNEEIFLCGRDGQHRFNQDDATIFMFQSYQGQNIDLTEMHLVPLQTEGEDINHLLTIN